MDADEARAVRELADAVTSLTPNGRPWLLATVTAVSVGAGTDGGDVVTVAVGDGTQQAPHLASYPPTVGDVVLVLLVNGSPLVLGDVVGLPSF